jgi:hypothetical protein
VPRARAAADHALLAAVAAALGPHVGEKEPGSALALSRGPIF